MTEIHNNVRLRDILSASKVKSHLYVYMIELTFLYFFVQTPQLHIPYR
jgi:hypothetical protein